MLAEVERRKHAIGGPVQESVGEPVLEAIPSGVWQRGLSGQGQAPSTGKQVCPWKLEGRRKHVQQTLPLEGS